MSTTLHAPDQVTFHRAERKFQILNGDLSLIRRILSLNCAPIIHESKVSTNHTLYFDDEQFSSYHENRYGISRRWKARIRWYGMDDRKVFFEFKKRSNVFSSKDRMEIHLPTPITHISYPDLKKILRQQLSPEQYERFLFRSNPILINDYKREYFRDPHSKIRLTLDYDIRCFNQMHTLKPSFKYQHHVGHVVILECKIPIDSLEGLERLLSPLVLRTIQSSKYILCLHTLGLSDDIY